MLLPRFLTALLGIPLILLLIWVGYLPFFLLVYAIIFLGLYEFYYLWTEKGYQPDKLFGYIFGSLLLFSFYFNGLGLANPKLNEGTALILSLGFLLYLAISLFRKKANEQGNYLNIILTFWGIIYVVWFLGHLLLIRELRPFGREYTYLLFLTAWISDTAAYFVGINYGQHYLARKISPKKTWEGTIAQMFAGILVVLVFKIFLLKHFSYLQVFVLGIILPLSGLFGDLTESYLKRQIGVKDSGSLLPGHGGILDRFDTLIFTAPVFYYYLRLFI
ncbi:MAG TPA: phosphatidate cytidylyltransferase [Elusimicrobia bacterium]|jgi:phosphatidate cytidylyltransferase|nr:phosphatidate cytidylyltransferase [Elusimicrobiota bacterium]